MPSTERKVPASRTRRDRLLDTITEGYGALLSVVEDTEGRAHKVSRTVLAEARKGEHEVAELVRKWIGSPTSFFDNFEAAVEVEARAQRRALELGRDTFVGAANYGGELRRALKRFTRAYRQGGDVAAELSRDAYVGVSAKVRDRVRERPRLISVLPARRRAKAARTRVPVGQPQTTEIQALVP